MVEALLRSFDASTDHYFVVTVCRSLPECLELGDALFSDFHISIFDLGFGSDKDVLLPGFIPILARYLRGPHDGRLDLRIVYTGFKTPANEHTALSYGVSHFVSKADCPPHELVAEISRVIKAENAAAATAREVQHYLAVHYAELRQEYSGQWVIIESINHIPTIQCAAPTLLKLLIDWHRLSPSHFLPHAHAGKLPPFIRLPCIQYLPPLGD